MRALSIVSLLVLVLIDLLLPHAVGFLELAAMPYVAIAVATAIIYGSASGLVAAAGSVAWIVLVGPVLAGFEQVPAYALGLASVPVSVRYGTLALAVTGLVVLNRVRRLQHESQNQAARIAELSEASEHFRAEAHALKLIHHKTRNRLATERSSITILYEQIRRLQSFDRNQVLDATLTAIRLMTGATSCVVYRFHEQNLELERIAVWPARHVSRYPAIKHVSSSIEGHVVRTGELFSLRQLIDHPELRELEENRAIICAPIVARNQTWGVLTVGRIPFLQYNEHAERALQVTAAIVAPALDQALPFLVMDAPEEDRREELSPRNELKDDKRRDDGRTGIRAGSTQSALHPYENLTRTLEEKLDTARGLGFHVMLLIVELQSSLEFDQQMELSRIVGEDIAAELGPGVAIYQYQQAYQLALLSVSSRSEAAGYLYLRVTELVGSRAWTVEDETVLPRAIVGFATSAQSGYEPKSLIGQAETMLQIYRRSES